MSAVAYLTNAETAKLIRRALASAFPGVKFSVRSSRGSAVHVNWTDGPLQPAVEAVAGPFQGKRFDGSIDGERSTTVWLLPNGSACLASDPGSAGAGGSAVREDVAKPDPGARLISTGVYVFCARQTSAALRSRVEGFIARRGGWRGVWRATDAEHAVYLLARRSQIHAGALFVSKDRGF